MTLAHTENTAHQEAPAKRVLSSDPGIAMQEMMDTIDTLRAVYVRETDALVVADTKAFLALQEEKLEAARAYQETVQEFLTRKEEMKNVNPLMKKQLEDMQSEFSSLAKKNMDALQSMQRSVERLGSTIRNAAKDSAQKERAVSYGEGGRLQSTEQKVISTGSVSETA